jgi:GNAT superfamily N-acetyltransferase
MEMTAVDDTGFIPTACPSIVAGLERGQEGFLAALAKVIVEGTNDGPAAFALFAGEPAGELVGAVACGPPYGLIAQSINAGLPAQAQMTEMQGLMGVSKLVGVAVHQDMRHTGIGTELVRVAEQVLRQCGCYFVMYGNCSAAVAPFYRRLGFKVERAINLWVVFGFQLNVSTPGMLIFSKSLRH